MGKSAFLLVGALVLLLPVAAWAHTEFESSTPADQELVDSPVSEIVVAFTLPVTIVGNGFEVLDPQGNVVSPSVETDDDTTFTLVLAEPLAGGDVGVRYEVAAEDGHVLAGGFSFTITAPAITTTTIGEAGSTASVDVLPSSTIGSTTTTFAVTTSVTEDAEDRSGSTMLWLGIGVAVVGGIGLYSGFRSRS